MPRRSAPSVASDASVAAQCEVGRLLVKDLYDLHFAGLCESNPCSEASARRHAALSWLRTTQEGDEQREAAESHDRVGGYQRVPGATHPIDHATPRFCEGCQLLAEA